MSLVPDCISGSEITDISEGYAVCLVNNKDGEEFISGTRSMHFHTIRVVDGYAKFTNRYSKSNIKKSAGNNTIVQDLSYEINFFNNLNIKYVCNKKTLKLKFNANGIDPEYFENFNTTVRTNYNFCTIFVTEYQNPTVPLEKFEIDLYQLSRTTEVSLKLNTDRKISVWAARNNV